MNFWSTPGTTAEQEAEASAIRRMKEILDTGHDDAIANIREVSKIPRVDIVDTVELSSGHTVAIKKTIWLSVFQRMLKKRYSKNNQYKRARYQ